MKYCLIYVVSESPFKMVTVTFKFTAKATFKFTVRGCKQCVKSSLLPASPSSLMPESPSSLLPKSPSCLLPEAINIASSQVYYQCHLQVYCQSHLQVYCQSHLQVYPPKWNCHWKQMKYWLIYCLIYVFSENPFETVGGIWSLLKFTAQVYSSDRAPSSLLSESPSSLLPDQSHLQVYCQSHLQVYPPGHSSMDIWKTITLPNFHDRLTPPPPLIDHRYIADCYTDGPPVNQTCIPGRPSHCIISWQTDPNPPPPIDHRSMEDHYTISVSWQTDPPLQSTIDAWYTTTPHKFYI